MSMANSLMERRAGLVAQMRDLAERAVSDNRDMTAEEDAAFLKMNAEVDSLAKRAEAIIEGETRAQKDEESFARLTGGSVTEDKRKDGKGKDEEIRAFLTGAPGAPRHYDFIPETRDVLKSGTGSGAIPTSFYAQLWEYAIETSAILGAGVTVLNTAGGEAMTIPRATVHSTASSTAEGAAITESDSTIAASTLTVAKYSYVTQLSREMLQDSGIDILGYLARVAGRELGNQIGANAVSVLLTAVTPSVTGPTGASGAFGVQSTAASGFDKLIDLYYSVIAPYRNSPACGWVMADPTAAAVRKIKDSAGQYIWQMSVIAGQPDMILGKPVTIDTNVPDVAISAESVLFGDLSSLYVRIAGGVRFERSDEFAFGTDLVTFRAVTRTGAVSVDPNAVKSFVGAGT